MHRGAGARLPLVSGPNDLGRPPRRLIDMSARSAPHRASVRGRLTRAPAPFEPSIQFDGGARIPMRLNANERPLEWRAGQPSIKRITIITSLDIVVYQRPILSLLLMIISYMEVSSSGGARHRGPRLWRARARVALDGQWK